MIQRSGSGSLAMHAHKFVNADSGSASVEFAASAILLFTILFGIVECSRAVYVYHFVGNASEEAARYAMVRGASWSSSCISATASNCAATSTSLNLFVQSIAPAGVSSSNLHGFATWPGTSITGATCLSSGSASTNSVGCTVSVTVNYRFAFVSPLLPQIALRLVSTSQVTIVQ